MSFSGKYPVLFLLEDIHSTKEIFTQRTALFGTLAYSQQTTVEARDQQMESYKIVDKRLYFSCFSPFVDRRVTDNSPLHTCQTFPTPGVMKIIFLVLMLVSLLFLAADAAPQLVITRRRHFPGERRLGSTNYGQYSFGKRGYARRTNPGVCLLYFSVEVSSSDFFFGLYPSVSLLVYRTDNICICLSMYVSLYPFSVCLLTYITQTFPGVKQYILVESG
ncbi:uncharacterized protein LOC134785165 [Penaeus indicus]|uniref:uncharacterized protein LOC134785165 n=1 Tax=Penaeus indicus TaxID=29960 RepID=UPI00300C1E28